MSNKEKTHKLPNDAVKLIRLPTSLLKDIVRISKKMKISASQFIKLCIISGIERYKNAQKKKTNAQSEKDSDYLL
jgi:hypothetical protein